MFTRNFLKLLRLQFFYVIISFKFIHLVVGTYLILLLLLTKYNYIYSFTTGLKFLNNNWSNKHFI